MSRYNVPPEVGVEALEHLIRLLYREGYFDQLEHEQFDNFWQKASDDLTHFAGKHQQGFLELIKKLEGGDLPDKFKTVLEKTRHRITIKMHQQAIANMNDSIIDTRIGEAVAWALRDAFFDEHPFFRQLLQWFFIQLSEAPSEREAMLILFRRLAEILYGSLLF
jgi:hypothetical protein